MYCLSVLKEQKEGFQVSFHLYCTLTEVKYIFKKSLICNTHYFLKSINGKYTYNVYHQLKSFLPLISYIRLISFHAY